MLRSKKHYTCLDCGSEFDYERTEPPGMRCAACLQRYAVQVFLLKEYLNQNARSS
jgi:DNA-directed RNA polymerase subunit RPC12/RpoP